MKKITSLLFVLILILGSLYMAVSKWDIIASHSKSLSFLRDEEAYSQTKELELKVKKLNLEIAKINKENTKLVYEKELSEINLKNYKQYSSQLKEYAETLISKYNVLEAQHSIKLKESANQQKMFNIMNDKVSQYNNLLNKQQIKINDLFSKLESQSKAIQSLNELSTNQMNQINTMLVKQQEQSLRSPASIKVDYNSKKNIVPKKMIKYIKPVDKFN